jgi:hypothetical protein
MRLCFFCFLLSVAVFSKEILTYEKISSKGTHTITYTVTNDKNDYVIDIEGKDQKTTLTASLPFSLKSYVTKKNKDFYEFYKEGSVIKAKGLIQGENLLAEFKASKKNPWIQEFDFGLRPLLESSKSSLNFQLINPKNFKMHKMVAKKEKQEVLKIGTTTYEAVLVEITLQGFKSMFWKAQIWYDKKTHDLLLYKANEGPNTPVTTVTLISKVVK